MHPGRYIPAVLLLACLAVPFIVSGYLIYVINLAIIYIAASFGMNILLGYTNQVSLGNAAFFGVGAYVTALMNMQFHIPMILSLLIAALLCVLIGIVIGLPALRLEDVYLAIATIGFVMLFNQVSKGMKITGGSMGLSVDFPSIGPWQLNAASYYYLSLVIIVFLIWMGSNLMKSRFGMAFAALKDTEVATRAVGINVSAYKLLAFVISAFYTGIAGGLFGFLVGYIDPTMFNVFVSVSFLSMVVIGGTGSVLGSVLGALFVTLVPQLFNYVGLTEIQRFVYGLTMVLILLFLPSGLQGAIKEAAKKFARRSSTPC